MDARGYPVPWFVAWIDGKPDFRILDPQKLPRAIARSLCWICGQPFAHGESGAFVIGPMCGINRLNSEPPSHLECAEFAVRACPFIVNPRAKRREANMPDAVEVSGIMHERNPGVMAVWISERYMPFRAPNVKRGNAQRTDATGWLIELGEPSAVHWYAEGRPATRAECLAGIDSGLLILLDMAKSDEHPASTIASLEYWRDELVKTIPAGDPE